MAIASCIHFQTYIGETKIVSRPKQRYVLEGHQGFVWCQNRSADEVSFYSYVDDAHWYRILPSGINHSINATHSAGLGVYSSGHTLIFYPTVREADQGYYYCCSSNDGSCSESTDVRISGKHYHYINSYVCSANKMFMSLP